MGIMTGLGRVSIIAAAVRTDCTREALIDYEKSEEMFL